MRKQFPTRQHRTAAAWAGALTLALTLSWGTSALAQSAEDEDLPLDTKILRQFLKDLGLRRDGEPAVEYRERAPLVVPPSRALPPPRSEGAVANNPAWPKDPDVTQRKVEAARKKAVARSASEAMIEDGRPLKPSELEKGRVAAGGASTTRAPTPEESARPMRPSELGASKGIFSGMFSSFKSDKGETAEFSAEPTRESLTAPPPGYQTPSSSHPYGLGPKTDKPTAAKIEDRATGPGR
jgi:hypothetical protein